MQVQPGFVQRFGGNVRQPLHVRSAFCLLAALMSCQGASGGKPSSGTGSTNGTTCLAGQSCPASTGTACGPGSPCDGSLVCVGGSCQQSDPTCSYRPPIGPFTPRIAWQWTSSTTQPDYTNVIMTPVVTPLQSPTPAGAPAVAFNAIPGGQGSVSFTIPGLMRAISGLDGTDLWTSDPAHPVNGVSQIAAGDLEGKGQTTFVTGRAGTIWPSTDPQHLGPPTDDGLVAFDNQGRFLWEVQGLNVRWGAPSIANLYGTAESQVVIGATVIDAHGHIVCQGADGQGDNYFGPLSTVADIDGDGIADIATGNTVYDNHCNPKPGWPNGQADGPVAVANFTGDAHPQIVVVANGTRHDW